MTRLVQERKLGESAITNIIYLGMGKTVGNNDTRIFVRKTRN